MAGLKTLTPAEAQLLEELARYRLLTADQAERLGVANITHARERLRSLRTAGLVHVTERGRLAGPNVYVLAPRGAAVLAEWTEGRIRAIGRKMAMQDTEHLNQRVAIVDVHIALRSWADEIGATVNWVRVEFDPNPQATAAQPLPATSATHAGVRYDPDMVVSMTTLDGRSWLFAVEVETGGRAGRLSHFKALLQSRLTAIRQDVLENYLSWPRENHQRCRLLFVFKNKNMLDSAIETVKKLSLDENDKTLRRVFLNSLPIEFENWWCCGEFHSPHRIYTSR